MVSTLIDANTKPRNFKEAEVVVVVVLVVVVVVVLLVLLILQGEEREECWQPRPVTATNACR